MKSRNYECPFCLADMYINPDIFVEEERSLSKLLSGKFMFQCAKCGSLDYIKKEDLK